MNGDTTFIAPHLQTFFAEHLCHHKRASPQTILSCRDTFRLLLTYIRDTRRTEPSALRLGDLDASVVLSFLDHLESQRGNSVRSRNLRLSAIRSFFRWIALREPQSAGLVTRVMAIPIKREDKKLVGYLSREEIDAIIAAPDQSHWSGRRDHALLLTLYNSGARVSEVASMVREQLHFGSETFLQLNGKGRKERTIPLWPHTARTLKNWLKELPETHAQVIFPNARRQPISRHGVNHLLQKAVEQAVRACPSLRNKRVSPHLVRHTTATHLLQAGVDIAVIALWLGHESIETTHVYLETDLATKEKALSRLDPIRGPIARFKPDDKLLAFLGSL